MKWEKITHLDKTSQKKADDKKTLEFLKNQFMMEPVYFI